MLAFTTGLAERPMRFLYSALLYALVPLLLLRMLLRSRRAPAYRRRLGERFGVYPAGHEAETASTAPAIWVHAVSVGELQASSVLVEALLLAYPQHRLVLTTTTPTGSARVRAVFQQRVSHVYLPWDLPGSVNRFLDRYRPSLALFIETELWPNLLAACRRRGCVSVLASARLSATSARRYRRVAPLTRRMLQSLDAIGCQTRADAQRFVALGAPADAVSVTGSLKYDAVLTEQECAAALSLARTLGLDGRLVWVAGSTHSGEEGMLLDALSQLQAEYPALLLVLAPRHPERFDAVAQLCASRGIALVRRSAAVAVNASDTVLLLDSIGELPLVYGAATVAFVGGSLVAAGGHNPLEAVRWSVPVVSGPHTDNAVDIYRQLQQVGAARQVSNAEDMLRVIDKLLAQPERSAGMGAAGEAVIAANAGACEATLALVRGLLAG
ncbi:MAG: lipid IV(A) 3-deoxy-D-manno-octulosonic acid transferase [Halioglobus sp.]